MPSQTNNSKDDSNKLVSLLALATGAVAIPQSSQADIIFTDLSSAPKTVGWSASSLDHFNFTLPGTAQFGFKRTQQTFPTNYSLYYTYTQTVVAGKMGGIGVAGLQGLPNGFDFPLDAGAPWDQGLQNYYNRVVGAAVSTPGGGDFLFPSNGYDHKYLAWLFSDTSQGSVMRYGWVEISLSMANFPVGPNVTIWGYAYDDSLGVQPTMGQMPIPEPTSAGLMVLGAMALGARGVRSWRRHRDAAKA